MGCFLACFGYSNKRRKRRKSSIRILCEDHGKGRYESLQPEVITSNIAEDPIKDKPKDSLNSKIRKKVSFNLNVKMYEPIPNDDIADCFPVSNEIETWERSGEVMEKLTKSLSNDGDEGNLVGSGMVLYPANYRYQNISSSYDEEDDVRLEESDLDDDNEYSGDTDEEDSWESKDEEDDEWKNNEFEFMEQFYSQNGSTQDDIINAPLSAERNDNCRPLIEDLKKFQGNCSVRDRSRYVHPVLNPVTNLSQWKVVKSKSVPSIMYQKENVPCQEQQRSFNLTPSINQLLPGSISYSNISKHLMQEEVVVSSLANWLPSKNTIDRKQSRFAYTLNAGLNI